MTTMTNRNIILSRRSITMGAVAAAGAALVAGRAAAQQLIDPTPGSDIGPFYPIQRVAEEDADMAWLAGHARRAQGEVIEVAGRVLDRHGNPVANAMLDIWQANAAGRYAHPGDTSAAPLDPDFQGFARLRAGADGGWRITTIRPGLYGPRTRHIHFDVSGRDHRLIAQMYFPEESAANARDILYPQLGSDAPRSTATAVDPARYRWDIVLLDS